MALKILDGMDLAKVGSLSCASSGGLSVEETVEVLKIPTEV